MGGSSSSASSSATNATDKRLAVDSGIGVTGDHNSVNFSSTSIDGGAISMAGDVAMGALVVTDNSIQAAIKGMVTTTENSLVASNLATQAAINSANNSLYQSLSANTSVTRDAISIADRSQNLIAKSASDSIGMVSHMADMAMQQTSGATDAVQSAVNQVARAYDTATNYQAEKSTADSKYLVYAALAVVGLAAVRGFK